MEHLGEGGGSRTDRRRDRQTDRRTDEGRTGQFSSSPSPLLFVPSSSSLLLLSLEPGELLRSHQEEKESVFFSSRLIESISQSVPIKNGVN